MDIRRRMFFKKKSSSSGGSTTEDSYTVNLNGQWEATTAVPNPDSTLYDGVYRSSSNYNVNNGVSIMYITIKDCSSFKMYIRSYAESNYDYVMVSQLDKTITGSTSYSDTTLVKAHTRGNQQSGTALSNYTLVEFTGISSGEHTITVVYRKDVSTHSGDDRGYVLIPKSNGSSSDEEEGGDIEVDTTYSIQYTSSDGNVVTPYATDVFGANITNNVYINGVGYLTFDGDVTSIGEKAFYNRNQLTSVTIPDSVTSIEDGAFAQCARLTSVTIGDSVTTIGKEAFRNCGRLTSVTIPDSVTTIRWRAFNACNSLTSVTIPEGVTTIEQWAFESCSSLENVTIPNSVTTIGNSIFVSCNSLKEFKGKYASEDGRCLIVNSTLNSFAPYGLTEYTLPSSVTTIGYGAFWGCPITSVTIPDSVTTIGERAFEACRLTSITIGNRVSTIGNSAFEACRLTSITIPSNVRSIKKEAFYRCTSLTSVYCKATTPSSLGDTDVFDNNHSDRKIYVPTGSVDAYKSATYWSEYASAIVGYNF